MNEKTAVALVWVLDCISQHLCDYTAPGHNRTIIQGIHELKVAFDEELDGQAQELKDECESKA